jgi:hypothetical protein
VFCAALRAYYRRLETEGYLLGGDQRRRGAPLLYDEPLLGFLAGQLAPVVNRVTAGRSRSTFTYLRIHDPGAILGRHRDQPSCRWNVDLVVGGEPTPARRTAWPLWIDGRRGPEAVRLGLGDGVLYRGDRLQHWRHAQPHGRTTVLASLHYGPPPPSKAIRRRGASGSSRPRRARAAIARRVAVLCGGSCAGWPAGRGRPRPRRAGGSR